MKKIVYSVLLLFAIHTVMAQTNYGPYKLFTSCSFEQNSSDSMGNDNIVFHNATIFSDPTRGNVALISKSDSSWFEYNTAPVVSDTFTLSFWYYWDAENDNAGWQSIFIFTKSGIINNHFYLTPNGGWNPSRTLLVGSKTTGTSAWEWIDVLPVVMETDKWYHFAISVNGTLVKTYVNGALTGNAKLTTTPIKIGADKFYFGCDPTYNRTGHTARYDDLKVFHQVLEANQIYALANNEEIPEPISFNDFSVSVVVNDADYIIHAPTPVSATITVNNKDNAAKSLSLIKKITTDDSVLVSIDTFAVNLEPGNNIFHFNDTITTPGFYRYNTRLATSGIQSDPTEVIFGVDPENIISPVDTISDFTRFWDDTRKELAAIEPNYTVTKIDRLSTGGRDIYEVEMTSLGNVRVKGYYAAPKAKGKYPVRMYFMGYGVAAFYPSTSDNGFAEFIVSARGQGLNVPEGTNYWEGDYSDYLTYGLNSKETYYYRSAYMDLIRAVDFVCTRSEVDTNMIFAQGTSQGGAYTFAVSALDNRIMACIPSVPFLSDFRDYFNIVSWPATNFASYLSSNTSSSWDSIYHVLSYIDIKNLAGWIKCPLLMSAGVQDGTCPGHINFAAYNQVISEKSYFEYPLVGHWVPSEFTTYAWTWIKDKLRKVPPTVVTDTATYISDSGATLNGDVYVYEIDTINSMGFCFSLSDTPSLNDNIVTAQKAKGSMNANIMELKSNSTYYYRAYAITANDTIYGSTMSFTTLDASSNADVFSTTKVEVYPSPVSDKIIIHTDGNEITGIILIDSAGIKQSVRYTSSNSNQYELDAGSLPKGIYFVTITMEGKSVTKKIVKQ